MPGREPHTIFAEGGPSSLTVTGPPAAGDFSEPSPVAKVVDQSRFVECKPRAAKPFNTRQVFVAFDQRLKTPTPAEKPKANRTKKVNR